MFQKCFEPACARHCLINLFDFRMSESLPAFAYRRFITKAAQENLDLLEGKIHVSSETYEQNPIDGISGITALPTRPVRSRNQAKLFVVSNRRCVHSRSAGKFSNFHGCLNIYP